MAAHQAPPSLGFSRQEHWSGLPFPSPMHESEKWKWKWTVKVKSISRVRLLVTPWTTAYQAPPSMGFSRQEYWSGVPLPSPYEPLEKTKKKKLEIAKKKKVNGCSGEEGWIGRAQRSFSPMKLCYDVIMMDICPFYWTTPGENLCMLMDSGG